MKNIHLIAVIALCYVYACRHESPEKASGLPMHVRVTDVSRIQMSLPVRSSGLVVPAREVKLAFKTGGIIAAVYTSEGASVNKGDLLATLNLSEMEALVKQATNSYDKAVRDYIRVKELYTDSVVTLEQLQNAETAMNVSKASLDAALFNMEHSRINAPEDGTILKQLAEANEVIAPGYPLFLFGISGKSWKVRAGLSDRDFVRVRCGDTALIQLDAYPGEHFRAVVSQVSEAANPQTGTYEVELNLQRSDHKLATGFVADLEIYPEKTNTYWQIPVEALVEADGLTGYVYKLTDSSRVERLKVSIARVVDDQVVISAGLEQVKKVITEGAVYLSAGDRVEVIENGKGN